MQQPTTLGESLKVLQLTDTHLFADRKAALRGCVTWDSLLEVVSHYEQSDWRADIVYLTGDLVQDDSREAYRHLAGVVEQLALPSWVIPGNHDVPARLREELRDSEYCGILRAAGWTLIGMSTFAEGRVDGVVSPDELERIRDDVVSASASALFLHHPPVTLGSRWLDAVGLTNRSELNEFVRQHPQVKLMIFGHVHQAYDRQHGVQRIIGTPSTGRQFKPGSDEFQLDDRPPAYRRLEFGPDGRFETELVWVEHD